MIEKTIITYHEKIKQYDFGQGHPFRGDRFTNAMEFFNQQGLFQMPEVALVEPPISLKEDVLRVHEKRYYEQVIELSERGGRLDVDTPISKEIVEAALIVAGSAIKSGEAVYTKEAEKAISIGGGYHHAGRNYGGGFCIFNDIAILVEYLRSKHYAKRILILDYDVHFGNGTSDIFYKDDNVLFISLHQDPSSLYPGTGFIWQTGAGKGEGYNICIPLPIGTSDNTYIHAMEEIFVPMAEEFKPDIIIGNGGSDSHFADTLGGLRLTAQGFFRISSLIKQTAETTCNGKLILLIGSGYNPKVLPLCWYALIAGTIGLDDLRVNELVIPPPEAPQCRKIVDKTLDELKRLLRKYWTSFGGFSLNTFP